MYPGPYRGTLERPILELPDRRALAYPSPLAFWPTFSWNPAEFSEVLREHDDVFEQEAASILFALRRDAGSPELNDLHFVMDGRMVALLVDGPKRLLAVDSRIAAVHSGLDATATTTRLPGGSRSSPRQRHISVCAGSPSRKPPTRRREYRRRR